MLFRLNEKSIPFGLRLVNLLNKFGRIDMISAQDFWNLQYIDRHSLDSNNPTKKPK